MLTDIFEVSVASGRDERLQTTSSLLSHRCSPLYDALHQPGKMQRGEKRVPPSGLIYVNTNVKSHEGRDCDCGNLRSS